ncbi:hypothetical protein P3L10_031178 [Capsicum annuum]
MGHKSFVEYVIWWRLEASKIHPSIPEEELVQIFLKSLEGIYLQKMFFLIGHSFESLISIGKKLEYELQAGRIFDNSLKLSTFQTPKCPSEEGEEDSSPSIPQTQGYSNNEEIHAIFGSLRIHIEPYDSQDSQNKIVRSRAFTPLTEPMANILKRLKAQGIMKPRRGWIPINPSNHFDPSEHCAYYSNIQGHYTEKCSALRYKIQNLIEQIRIKVQRDPVSNNLATTGDIFFQGDPTKVFLRPS